MALNLREFITVYREVPSIEEERCFIADHVAYLRTLVRDCPIDEKATLVAKLVFLNILGQNTAWGQMTILQLMASEKLSYKRIGYLAAANILDESSDLHVLVTQTVMKDLEHPFPLIHAQALTFIANMGSTEMCQTVYPQILKLIESPHPGVMKRAGMAAVKILRRIPEMAHEFRKPLVKLLGCTKHAVVATGVILACEMIKIDPSLANTWIHFSKPFTKLLRVLSVTKPSNEFRMSIFNDPFLQIKTMKLLGILKERSDELDDVLTALVTSVDLCRNTGRALLFQAVETIGLTAKKPSLCGLAFNQIGRLLSFKDPNVLYSALSVFSRVLYNGREIINRGSSDSLALQRYKSQIVHCIDHRDLSIRRRALDVILALVDESNIETLVPELIEYLHLVDNDFRTEMVAKIYSAVQRFAPNPMWNFDIVHMLIIDSGAHISNDIVTSFCKLIATHKSVRDHAIPLLSNTVYGYSTNQALIQVGSWVVGEFSTHYDPDVVETFSKILTMKDTTVETKCYLLLALAKIATRFKKTDSVIEIFDAMAKDRDMEVQQRAGELLGVIRKPELWDSVLAPLEYEDAEENEKQTATLIIDKKSDQVTDLLDLDSAPAPSNGTICDDLLDIAGLQTPTQSAKVIIEEPKLAFSPPPNAKEAFRTTDFVVYFEIQKNAANPKQIAIRSSIYNLCSSPLKNFNIQYGVPVGWVLRAQPPSDSTVEPGAVPLRQILLLENQGTSPLMMKTHTTYLFGCQPLTQDNTVNQIFDCKP